MSGPLGALLLAFDLALAGLTLWVAWRVVTSENAFQAVVLFVVLGLLIAVAWLRLEAPNVALAEAAVGAGLTGVLLLETLGRLRRVKAQEPPSSPQARHLRRWGVAVPVGIAGAGLGAAVWLLEPATHTAAPLILDNRVAAGADNPVTAVLLNFRSADTLLEIAVLFLAVAATYGLSERRRSQAPPDPAPPVMLAWFAQRLAPLGLVVGVALWWLGTSHPGGAFQAGAVLGAVFALLLVTGQTGPLPAHALAARLLVSGGTAAFTLLGLVLLAHGGAFMAVPVAAAKVIIVTLEGVLTASIAVCLAALVSGIPEART